MKDESLALAAAVEDPVRKLNVMREYVQAFVLRSLHELEAFRRLAFVGGNRAALLGEPASVLGECRFFAGR